MVAAIDVRIPTNYPNKWIPMSDQKDPQICTKHLYLAPIQIFI